LIDHPTHDIGNIQKKVLFVLLSEEYVDHINVTSLIILTV